jgi:5-formyltetrahydrofolate cyclo-ligase
MNIQIVRSCELDDKHRFCELYDIIITAMPPLTKAMLRCLMRERLAALTLPALAEGSANILARLTGDAAWCSEGATVALFGGIQGEPDLLPLIPWLVARGARPVFFGLEAGELVPFVVRDAGKQLASGPFGVWVPREAACERIEASALAVVLTPGLAFSHTDHQRLGRGRGYYDKLFARPEVRARRIGVGFGCQLVDHVPCEPHDMPLDAVVVG